MSLDSGSSVTANSEHFCRLLVTGFHWLDNKPTSAFSAFQSLEVKLTSYCMVCLDHSVRCTWSTLYHLYGDFDSALDNLVMNFEGLRDYGLHLKDNKHK